VEMEDTRAIFIPKLAALERAKALGLEINRCEISAFERQAHEWKRRIDVDKSEVQGPMSEVRSPKSKIEIEDDGSEAQSAKPSVKMEDDIEAGKANEGFDWQPYLPEQSETEIKTKEKTKNLNAASIWSMARKIMAREWAMALGGRSLEGEQASLEQKAAKYRDKKAAERERKEIEQQRAHKRRKALEEALMDFSGNLLKAPRPVAPEEAEALLEEALGKFGDTIRIAWNPDGCHIFIEPWDERRLRNKAGEPLPAVFQATVDDNLMLSSFEKIQDPQLLQETQNDLILNNILSSFRKSHRKDSHAFENAVSEGGRIIRATKMNGGGKINFEPWEEMRRRNLERKGRPPVVTYVINADKDFNRISCERI